MYDAIKAIEIEELKKKLEAVGGKYEFADDDRPCLDVWNPESSGETITVYINSVSVNAIGMLEFDAEMEESYKRIALNVDDFMYESLSYIADEIQYPRQVWMRIGCTVRGTKEQMDTVMKGEDYRLAEYTLKDMLNNGQVDIDGSCHIPESCVEDYNEEYGDDVEVGDIDFG
ncbi:MAG: hypothetical protein ACI4SO_07605 [Muribaculaceae bacterium]